MRVIYLVLISCLLYFPANAQFGYGKPKDILEVKKRTLIIMLESENSKMLEKSDKKVEKYQTRVIDLNESLRTLGEHWEFHDEVLYMESSEIMKLKKKKQHQYAVLYIQRLPIKQKAGMLDVNKFDMRYRVSADLSLTLIEKFPSKKPVTAFTLANPVPSLGDLVST